MSASLKNRFILPLLVSIFPSLLHAGGFNNPDMGPRRNAMFAVTAMPDDTTAIMHNPAGLADQRGNRFYLSGMGAFLNLSAELKCEEWMERYDWMNECSGREYTKPLSPERTFGISPFIGFSADLNPLVENLVIGTAVYAPNFLGAFMDEFSLARFHGIESLFLTVLATGSLAYRPSPYISFGAGASYMHVLFQTWRRMDMLGGEIDLKLDGKDHTRQFHLGLLISPFPWMNIGFGFDTETQLEIKGDVRLAFVDLDDYDKHENEYYVLRHETNMVVPYKLKAGVNIRPHPMLEIGLDYFFWRYSVFEEQVTHFFEVEETDGPAQLLAGQEMNSPRHMNDSHNLCGGIRVLIPGLPFPLWLMTGAQYDWSPGNDEYFSLDSPYADIYGVSMGFDSQPLPRLKIGAAWIHNRFRDIDIEESKISPPTNMRANIYNNQLQMAIQVLF